MIMARRETQTRSERYRAMPRSWGRALAWVLVLGCGVALTNSAGAVEVRYFANGIHATIYTPQEILGAAKSDATGDALRWDAAHGTVILDGDADKLVPFAQEDVERALADMHGLIGGIDVIVYILPATPLASSGSFARQDAIYLAPGTGPVDPATVAYITTHEMGHVLTWAHLDPYPARWDAYLQLRGLDPDRNGPLADHANRAREILAEDVRVLFGGKLATASGSIENHDLTRPREVEGLQELLSGYFADRTPHPAIAASTAFPNPCNPLTTIAMVVPVGVVASGDQAVLRIFDVRGAVVQTLRGGNLANDRITMQWTGTTDSGRAVASGRYLYVIQAGELTARGAVTLIR